MPPVPRVSPATGCPVPAHFVHTTAANFVDAHGRTLLLRGVNLSGSSKAPLNAPSYILDDFWETAENGGESFVGRPLNLDDGSADIHLARLRGWGFNMLRYVVTWESLEHEGPGKFDFEYMDYTVRVLRKCKDYGFKVFMDPHQDLWSRFSGGSGAPFWTLHACGLNPRNFTATQGTILHAEYPNPENPDPASLPAMIWSTNYARLVPLTVFTLFFAGRDFAPKCIIDGVNIQDYLQNHYLEAFALLAERIGAAGDLLDECVLGWDSMNEPFEGLLGHENLNLGPRHQPNKKGTCPTPAQSLRLGMGQAQTVENWKFTSLGPHRDGSVTIDPKGHKAWLDPLDEPQGVSKWGWKRSPEWELGKCIWALHNVWDPISGEMLIPDYFARPPFDPARPVLFTADYWRPHFRAYAARIRAYHPETILFLQPPVFVQPPPMEDDDLRGRGCYSPHYYDGLTLVTRHWNWFNADALGLLRGKYSTVLQALKIGETAIRKSLQEQIGMLKNDALEILGPSFPTLLGEIGTPFDMDGRRSYGYSDGDKYLGDYSAQQKALDASLNAADGPNALNWTIWTYCPDSTHEWGDGWNMEDLSLWSADDLRDQKGRQLESDAEFLPTESSAGLINNASANLSQGTVTSLSPPTRQMFISTNTSTSTISTLTGAPSFPLRACHKSQSDSAFGFLTDGARAVGAFVRPWPIAVVGLIKDIKFDLRKAEFTLVITVRADDAPPHRSDVNGSDMDDDVEPLPTEIFVPLVHYSADPSVRSTLGGSASPYPPSLEAYKETDAAVGEIEAQFTNHLPKYRMTRTRSDAVMYKDASTDSAATAVSDSSAKLDLDVEVSGGTWTTDDQILRWHYPIPQAGEDPVEYHIRIRRGSGPIKSVLAAGATTRESSCWSSLTSVCGLM